MFMLAMPAFVVLVELFLLSVIATSVLPEFESIIPKSAWPGITVFVSDLGTWIHNYWFVFPLGIVSYPIVFGYYKSRLVGDTRSFCDKYLGFLGFDLYRETTASQFLTMLGHLMRGNNFVLAKALSLIIDQSPDYLKWHASRMLASIGNETEDPDLSSAMDTGLLNDEDLANIRIAAEGKDMAYSISMVAEEKIDVIGDKIKRTQLFAQMAVAIITSTLSLLIVFSTAPLALSMQAAFKH
jgi:type II secretory pathway component PulF